MKEITKIEATPVVKNKLRVAAYVRVSTSMEDQLLSLKAQKEHYEDYIKSNPDWEYAGIYVDRGISGTKMARREALLELLYQCENGQVHRVLTKSISRFARNTTECLTMVRKLTRLGVSIFFENENLDTEQMDSELLLSIMGSIAESESRSISENMKWSIQRRMKNGTYIVSTPPYGYKNEQGAYVVEPKEAAIVKRIFQMSLEGYGCDKIARTLNKEGIMTRFQAQWQPGYIRNLLCNEAYTGDLLLQKFYTDEKYCKHINYGEKDKYLYQGHHEALVSQEVFEKVNREMEARGRNCKLSKFDPETYRPGAFSKKLICGECGSTLRKNKKRGQKVYHTVWECKNARGSLRTCHQRYIKEDMIEYAFLRMLRKLQIYHKEILQSFMEGLKGDQKQREQIQDIEAKIEKYAQQKEVLEQTLFSGHLEREVFQREMQILQQKKKELEANMLHLQNSFGGDKKHLKAANRLQVLVSRKSPILEFDSEMFREHVEKVSILSREKLVFHLTCGLNLEERMM